MTRLSYACTISQNKLIMIVSLFGDIVMVTGDSVNNASALNEANTGLTMGIGGSAILKKVIHRILSEE
jgi:magnesium-transporting ATPase (P-type)